jgi:hypothetical protein
MRGPLDSCAKAYPGHFHELAQLAIGDWSTINLVLKIESVP